MKKYVLQLLTILFFFCVVAISVAQDYVVREGDVLKISVYDNPDLTTVARISGNGTITFPLIGELNVSGKTVSQISQSIAEKLATGYIINPQVSIFLEDYKARKIYVTGEVKKPDAYKYEEGSTVIKLITMAGGFTDKAAPGRIKIMRKINNKAEVLEKVTMDQPVQPDDVVVVPESFF
ncbi:MAG: polysaccharide biosynthesis/export family protein [Thermodesulfovibrionales bacterium]